MQTPGKVRSCSSFSISAAHVMAVHTPWGGPSPVTDSTFLIEHGGLHHLGEVESLLSRRCGAGLVTSVTSLCVCYICYLSVGLLHLTAHHLTSCLYFIWGGQGGHSRMFKREGANTYLAECSTKTPYCSLRPGDAARTPSSTTSR